MISVLKNILKSLYFIIFQKFYPLKEWSEFLPIYRTKPNISRNLDLWGNGEQVLYIIGGSGAGKTTLSEKVGHNAIVISIDQLQSLNYESSIYVNDLRNYFSLICHKIDDDNLLPTIKLIEKYALEHWDKPVIIEGFQITFNVGSKGVLEFYHPKPMIMLRTSVFSQVYRLYKRGLNTHQIKNNLRFNIAVIDFMKMLQA